MNARIAARASLPLLAVCALGGCGEPKPTTELVIDLIPGAAIAREAHDVAVHVDSGHATDRRLETMYDGVTDAPPPVRIGLIPRGEDPTRILALTATARDPTGATIATVRVRTGYVARRITHLIMHFEDACRAVVCPDDQTCREGACVDAAVDATSLPEFPADGGIAPVVDAGVPLDSGP